MRYDNNQDISQRLASSVLKYEDDFYYASLSDRVELALDLYPLRSRAQREKTVSANDEKLFHGAFPLGYVNSKDKTVQYLTRMPVRRYKVGITPENTTVLEFFKNNGRPQFRRVPVDKSFLVSPEARSTYLGQYPTFDEGMELVKSKEWDRIAVDRKMAIGFDDLEILKVSWFGTTVGIFSKNKILVPEKYGVYAKLLETKTNIPIGRMGD